MEHRGERLLIYLVIEKKKIAPRVEGVKSVVVGRSGESVRRSQMEGGEKSWMDRDLEEGR